METQLMLESWRISKKQYSFLWIKLSLSFPQTLSNFVAKQIFGMIFIAILEFCKDATSSVSDGVCKTVNKIIIDDLFNDLLAPIHIISQCTIWADFKPNFALFWETL